METSYLYSSLKQDLRQEVWYALCMRRVLVLLVLFFCAAVFHSSVQAVGDFTKSLNVSYSVEETGETRVSYEVRLKNNFSTVYAKQYALTINSPDVKDVQVKSQEGKPERFELVQTENQSSVTVYFAEADKVIGRDRERVFTLTYVSKDIASIYGNVLEISLPKLADPDSYSQYNVVIAVPERFGAPTLVEPARYTHDNGGGQSVLRFTNVGQKTGISVLFGESQTYDVDLVYHVQNTSQNVGVVQVALPPDTAFQKVAFRDVQPRPERITADADGNWIAEFRVAGQAQQDVRVRAAVTVFARPQAQVGVTNPFKPAGKLFGGNDRSLYLQPTVFWPTSNPAVQKIVQTQQTPQQIYSFVVDTLQYNYRRFQQSDAVTRLGALGALQDPNNAVCLEYADLFVALSRAAGVPARRVTGYAITQNSRLRPLSLVADVLHAWPEYYDAQRNTWIPVDPTWGDTTGGLDYFSKLDLRHITFAIQGQNDERPLPAGMYKVAGQEEKDVTVALSQATVTVPEPLAVEKKPSLLPQFGIPTQEVFRIRNTSGEARYNVEVAVGVQGQASLLSSPTQTIPVLLPYQEHEVTVSLTGTSWIHPQKANITLFLDNKEHAYEVNVRKAFIHPAWRWLAVGGVIALISFATGCVLVLILRRFRVVRRKG